MIEGHHNTDYNAEATPYPDAAADRYYSQDLFRDFWYLMDKAGLIGKDLEEGIPFIVSGGVVSKGTGNTLNITVCVGYVEYEVRSINTGVAWAVPPTTSLQDVDSVRVESTTQSDMAIASAVLDDSTVNYVKLTYTETGTVSRTKVKGTGSYNSINKPSFAFVVDDTAPTNKDLVLAQFVSSGGAVPSTFDLISRSYEITDIKRNNFNDMINSRQDIWQDGTSFVGITDETYFCDQHVYRLANTTAVNDIAQENSVVPDNYNFSSKITVTTADAAVAAGDKVMVEQRIEGFNINKYFEDGGKWGTVGVGIYTNKTGTYCLYIQNDGEDRSWVKEVAINSSNTWTWVDMSAFFNEIGGTWDYGEGIGFRIGLCLMGGATFQTSDTEEWVTGNYLCTSSQVNFNDNVANILYFTGLSMNLGRNIIVPLNPNYDYEKEVERCQRYFEKTYDIDVAPGTATASGIIRHISGNHTNALHTVGITWQYKVKKRIASPTIVVYGTSGTANRVNMTSGELAPSAISAYSHNAFIRGSDTVASTNRDILFQATVDARL